MDREVRANDFPQRRCTVFPGFPSQHGNPRHGGNERNQKAETLANNRVRKQEVIAINQTANSHDAMLAFVQIMCKRFFTCKQELFVETAADDKTPNSHITQAQANNAYGGLTRLALTSNDYARLFAHRLQDLETPNQWEIIIVRPNIEHNMLAAVLGRGGSDELGSTFWGQTELSCYDDSMHGENLLLCSNIVVFMLTSTIFQAYGVCPINTMNVLWSPTRRTSFVCSTLPMMVTTEARTTRLCRGSRSLDTGPTTRSSRRLRTCRCPTRARRSW
jgi:hypothetical protein